MDESLAAGIPEAGMALVSALDDVLRAQGSAGKREGEGEHGAAMGLKALDDVDMDMDIDVDVFRPSAMLDTRLDEEFGSARDFGGLWHNDGVERSHVDLEHMLLSESDEELLGLLRQEQAAETGGLLQDPLRRRVFAIRAGRVATDGVVEATDLPPKYSGGVSAKVESGRSVFRHTFGERSQRFGFAGATRHDVSHFRAQPAAAAAGAAAGETVATLTASLETTAQVASPYHFDSTLGAASSEREIHEAEEEDVDMEADESPAPVAVVTANSYCSPAGVDISIKQEVVIKDEPAAFKHEVLDVTPVTPVRPQPIAHPSAPVSLASSDTPAASSPAMFHTPLRRSMSSPSPSVFSSPPSTSLSEKTSFVSLDRMASIDGLGFAHGHSSSENNLLNASQFRSMSPADELEKVAALHDKGTLGKLDKVEWRASPASAQSNSHGSGSEEDQSEQLKIMRSSEGSADRPSIAVVVSGSPATSLPPRYIKGPTDKEKRRVHSSTFQSFARSFSFSNAPSSSSALD